MKLFRPREQAHNIRPSFDRRLAHRIRLTVSVGRRNNDITDYTVCVVASNSVQLVVACSILRSIMHRFLKYSGCAHDMHVLPSPVQHRTVLTTGCTPQREYLRLILSQDIARFQGERCCVSHHGLQTHIDRVPCQPGGVVVNLEVPAATSPWYDSHPEVLRVIILCARPASSLTAVHIEKIPCGRRLASE